MIGGKKEIEMISDINLQAHLHCQIFPSNSLQTLPVFKAQNWQSVNIYPTAFQYLMEQLYVFRVSNECLKQVDRLKWIWREHLTV